MLKKRHLLPIGVLFVMGCSPALKPGVSVTVAPAPSDSVRPTPVTPAAPRGLTGLVSSLTVKSEYLVDIAAGPDGSLYLAELNGIRRVTPDGQVSVVAEVKNEGAFQTDPRVIISNPVSIAVTQQGAVYVLTHRFLWVIQNGVQTIRGEWDIPNFADGGLVVDSHGNAYFIMRDKIKKVSPDGTLTNYAGADDPTPNEPGLVGSGYQDGPAQSALFRMPEDLALDAAGNLYVADVNNSAIRKISPAGMVSTVIGQGREIPLPASPGPGEPSPDLSAFESGRFPVVSIAVDTDGTIYAGCRDHFVRRISPEGQVSSFAGDGTACREPVPSFDEPPPSPDPPEKCWRDGQGNDSRFLRPRALTLGPVGSIYLVDGPGIFGQQRIRQIQ